MDEWTDDPQSPARVAGGRLDLQGAVILLVGWVTALVATLS